MMDDEVYSLDQRKEIRQPERLDLFSDLETFTNQRQCGSR